VIRSTSSRSGRLTLATGWHWPAGGPLDVTTPVAFEIAAAEPTLFVAVTSMRSVWPTSSEPRTYAPSLLTAVTSTRRRWPTSEEVSV
jgi:hypothetical protein